jgi:hypothetical protein
VKYRKKSTEVDAIQWTGENAAEVLAFMGEDAAGAIVGGGELFVDTMEGTMAVKRGEWIVMGVFRPVRPDVFDLTYERV